MSGFGKDSTEESKGGDAARIVSSLLQSIFPPINVHTISLSQCKRVVLFTLVRGEETDGHPGPLRLEFRHYEISTRQRSANKAVISTQNNPSYRLEELSIDQV